MKTPSRLLALCLLAGLAFATPGIVPARAATPDSSADEDAGPGKDVSGNGGVVDTAKASAKQLVRQLRDLVSRINAMVTGDKAKEKTAEIRAEVDKARKAVDKAVDRVSVTGGRGTQRNFTLRQMSARLDEFRTSVREHGDYAEAKAKAELRKLKDTFKKVEDAFKGD